MSNSCDSTPPTHPTYGIHLSNEAIRSIIQGLLPKCTFISAVPLERGKSFNNRIYFVKVELPANYESQDLKGGTVIELVLKVNGQFFGPSKVQNEVSCLTLLSDFLPEIPSPKVIAWSDTQGTIFSTLTPHGIPEKKEFHFEAGEAYKEWILITKVPGTPVSDVQLSDSDLEDIGRQLGDIVFPWRDKLPVFPTCGNIRCEAVSQEGKGLEVRGLQLSSSSTMPQFGVDTPDVITTHLQYYKLKLEARLQQLQHGEVFQRNKHLVPTLREFIDTRLPQLEICNGENQFFFTHYDLAPRNVLVSMNPGAPRITGIIDFEFAGFFPELDEFVNDAVPNKGAWPDMLYQAYLGRLEERGIKTPRKGISSRAWEEALALGRLEENIAPWWLENVTSDAENLEDDLSRAREAVGEAIHQSLLNCSVGGLDFT